MSKYEVMFIVDADLEEDQKEGAVNFVKDVITGAAGEVEKVDIWGMRKLAYPIQKKNEGFYTVMEFTGPPDLPKELDRRLKISDNIVRHIIVNIDAK
ncbi:MAG TPA: 30S ribosomal protein S6 [Clostridiales bacterium]|jgi:small subunit ribosomal protein S6|nr:30S ribosomal protein S6 [Clostridiales bacterium]